MVDRAVAYLRSAQDESGGWAIRDRGPQLPAISALVLKGMLLDPDIDQADETVARGVDWMLSFIKPDGGVHDGMLPSYNTSVCLSTLALLDTDEARAAIPPAQDLLRGLQYSESAIVEGEFAETTARIPRDHPYYGGVGYGRSSRPDMSNLQLMLQGLHDSGVSPDDPAFSRALVFLERTQMVDEINGHALRRRLEPGRVHLLHRPERGPAPATESRKPARSSRRSTTAPRSRGSARTARSPTPGSSRISTPTCPATTRA